MLTIFLRSLVEHGQIRGRFRIAPSLRSNTIRLPMG